MGVYPEGELQIPKKGRPASNYLRMGVPSKICALCYVEPKTVYRVSMDLYGHQIKRVRDCINTILLPQGYLKEVQGSTPRKKTVTLSIPKLINELDSTLRKNTHAALTLDEHDKDTLTKLIDSSTTRAMVGELFPTEEIAKMQSFDLCLFLASVLWSKGTTSRLQSFSPSDRLGAEILIDANSELFAVMKDQLSSKLATEFRSYEKHTNLQRMSVETLVNLRVLFEKVRPPAPLIEKLKWAMMPFGAPEAYIFERVDRNLDEILSEVAKRSLTEYHIRRKRKAK